MVMVQLRDADGHMWVINPRYVAAISFEPRRHRESEYATVYLSGCPCTVILSAENARALSKETGA